MTTKTMTINHNTRTIEMTKKFAELSSRFGTPEYYDLQQVRRDYPRYSVRIKTTSKKNGSQKGLNYEFMKSYIKEHNESLMEAFNYLSGKDEVEEGEEEVRATYGQVKKWFLNNFPELDTRKTKKEKDEKKTKENQKRAKIYEILNSSAKNDVKKVNNLVAINL